MIWLINPFDDLPWEGKPQRYATLARCLSEQGHPVVHWSSDFFHRLKQHRVAPAEGAPVLPYQIELVPTPAYARNVSVRRILNHRAFGRRLVQIARQKIAAGELEKPSLILASMPPLEGPIAALALKELFGCKVIVDVMDAWPATLLQALPRPLANRIGRGLAQVALLPYALQLSRACREADAISAQSKAFAAFAHANGAAGKPTHVCLLGADAPGDTIRKVHAKEDKSPRPLRLLYLGAMGRSYDLDTVLDAIEKINAGGILAELICVGDGEKRSALEARGVAGVTFTGFLQGAELDAALAGADLGVVPFYPESGVSVPYKAGDYLAYGLPLLSTIGGELAALVGHYQCGQQYTARDADSLVRAIEFYRDDSAVLETHQAQAWECFAENFDRARTYPIFSRWITEMLPS